VHALITPRVRRTSSRVDIRVPKITGTRLRAIFVAASVGFTFGPFNPVHALGLADAYEAALGHDPVYAGAMKEKEAGDANRAIGRSYLLPNLSANYANYRDWTGTTYFGPQYGNAETNQTYRAYSAGMSLRQPLVNFEGIARYRYGKAAALASDATFADRSEQLLVRVLSAYTRYGAKEGVGRAARQQQGDA
jgi:protease secretion system outer membrane protein